MSDLSPHIDVHTGAWKRDYFQQKLVETLSLARRKNHLVALLRVDIDDLQELNDLHGRETLDGTISWLAQAISNVVDGQGPLGRLGGDDFAVFLPDTRQDVALALAERVRQQIPKTTHTSEQGPYRLTVSVGLAFARRSEPWGNLLDAAEQACLRAKQGGRNTLAKR